MRRCCALLLLTFFATPAFAGGNFIRGDANSDGLSNLADSTYIAAYLFTGGPAPSPVDAGDVNDNGVVETSDIVYLLTFVFLAGPFPPAPFPLPGPDPTPNVFDPPVDPAFTLALGNVIAATGSFGIELPLTLTNPEPVNAVQCALTFDSTAVEIEEWNIDASVLGDAGAEFIDSNFSNTPGSETAWFAVVIDFATPILGQTLPPGVNKNIANLVISVPQDAAFPQTTVIAFTDGIDTPPKYNLVTIGFGQGIQPGLDDGIVDIQRAFVRGDANQDDVVNLADAVYIVNFFFLEGPGFSCEDAADANNDGIINIADTVYILNYIFAEGPTPSEPFPFPGFDPDEDDLGCDG